MKWLVRIGAGLVIIIGIGVAALGLYLTDERLTRLVEPPLQEALGETVRIGHIGYSLFRTFPNFGLVVEDLELTDPAGQPVLNVAELRVMAPLMPLLRGDIRIHRLDVFGLDLAYLVAEDGTTNLDFLTSGERDTAATQSGTTHLNLDRLDIRGATIRYVDRPSDMDVLLADLSAVATIHLGDVIVSDVDGRIGGLSLSMDGTRYLDGLPIAFRQTSRIDPAASAITLDEGYVSIRGLALNTAGRISGFDGDTTSYRFEFASKSDNFGALLDLLPEAYKEDLKGVETRGSLTLKGQVKGHTAQDVPEFDIVMAVTDGFFQHPSAPKPIRDIQLDLTATNSLVRITSLTAEAEANTVSMTADIRNPLAADGRFTLNAMVKADLSTLESFYPISNHGMTLRGRLDFKTEADGSVSDLEAVRFSGGMTLGDVFVAIQGLDEPIRDMSGRLTFTQANVELRAFTFRMGSSDFDLTGSVFTYRNLFEEVGKAAPGRMSATYVSKVLNVDEIWQYESNDDPLVVDLPNLDAQLTVRIDSLVFVKIPITQIRGRAVMSPRHLELSEASAGVYEGGLAGFLSWDILKRDHTRMTFRGDVTNVRSEAFFRQFQLGGKSEFHNHVSGGFTAKVEFQAEMDEQLEQDPKTIQGNGRFGMDRARLKGHPIQVKVAEGIGAPELADVSLDAWTASFTIVNGLMTLRDMRLSSKDIGLNLNGTQNLVTDRIDFKVHITLPGSYGNRLERLLTKDGVEALKNDAGMIVVPMAVTGTSADPTVGVDRDFLKAAIAEYLKKKGADAAGRILRGIIRN
jgi:hypothetical protein